MKIRAWNNDLKQFFYVDNSFSISLHDTGNTVIMWSSDGIVDEFPADGVMSAVDIKDNDEKEIWFGDVYYIAGHGNFHISDNTSLNILFDAVVEGDLGDYIGNIHQNPELLTST